MIQNIQGIGFSYSEPADGGNIDPSSTMQPENATLVVRTQENEASGGQRWENFLYRLTGMMGKAHSGTVSLSNNHGTIFRGIGATSGFHQYYWSPTREGPWIPFQMTFDTSTEEATYDTIRAIAHNDIYVSFQPRTETMGHYTWIETRALSLPYVSPTASGGGGTGFQIGTQSGAQAGGQLHKDVPDFPLYAFLVMEEARSPDHIMIVTSGQHPFENQKEDNLRGFVDFITSENADAQAFRDRYATLVYPHINPTGFYAGLWRGTAANPSLDTNRRWDTLGDSDTVDAHKAAFPVDVAALNMGDPLFAIDMHQPTNDEVFAFTPDINAADDWVSVMQQWYPDYYAFKGATGSDRLRMHLLNELNIQLAVGNEFGKHKPLSEAEQHGEHLALGAIDIIPFLEQ